MSMPVHIRSGASGAILAALASALILLVATLLTTITTAAADEPTPEPTETVTVTVDPTPTTEPTTDPTPTVDPTPTTTVDPTPTTEPTETVEPTPTETVEPTPTPTVEPVPPGWKVERFELGDGRSYYARVPVCAPADTTECSAYLGRKRQVLLFAHGFNGLEDQQTATDFLNLFGMSRKSQQDTIFVYGVTKAGQETRGWNAGVCCVFTEDKPDDVSYLVDVARDLPSHANINPARTGVFGWSNGGMLALKAGCERPDVFDFGSSWAGTYVGPCAKVGVKVMQMHGAADTTVPVNGGRTYVAGRWLDVPPAADLAKQLVKGSSFPLTVHTGIGHQITLALQATQLNWAFANLRG